MLFGDFALMAALTSGLQFVGSDTQSLSPSTSDITISLTGLAGGVASAPAAGDTVIVVVGITTAGVDLDLSSSLSGYSISERYQADTFATNTVLGTKTMGSSPDTSITLTGGTQGANNPGIAMIQVWRGVNSADPLGGTGTLSGSSNTILVNPPAPGGSPVAGTMQLGFAAGSVFGVSPGSYSSSFYTGLFTGGSTTSAGLGGSIIGAHGWTPWVSGSDNPPAFTYGGSDSTADSCVAYTFCLAIA